MLQTAILVRILYYSTCVLILVSHVRPADARADASDIAKLRERARPLARLMLMTATELAHAAPPSSSPPSSYSPSSARELHSVGGTAWGILAQVCV